MAEEQIVADFDLDLRGEVCPYTFVKSRITLEEMQIGQVLKITVDNATAVENVPHSLKLAGQQVLAVRQQAPSAWSIFVRKVAE